MIGKKKPTRECGQKGVMKTVLVYHFKLVRATPLYFSTDLMPPSPKSPIIVGISTSVLISGMVNHISRIGCKNTA